MGALSMFQQKATRAAIKMESIGMLEGQGDLFALMQSVTPKKSENTTRDQEIFKSFVKGDLRGDSGMDARALPTDLFTDKNKNEEKKKELKVKIASEEVIKGTSPPPEPKQPEFVPKKSPEVATSKMKSWGWVSPVSLKEDGTEPVFRARKSPPPEEKINLQRPKLSDLLSHNESQKVKAPTNKNKSKSKEETARIEKL